MDPTFTHSKKQKSTPPMLLNARCALQTIWRSEPPVQSGYNLPSSLSNACSVYSLMCFFFSHLVKPLLSSPPPF